MCILLICMIAFNLNLLMICFDVCGSFIGQQPCRCVTSEYVVFELKIARELISALTFSEGFHA